MTVVVDNGKCIGCGACVVECPLEALDLIDGIAVVDPAKCKDNGSCVEVCPTNALALEKPAQGAGEKEQVPSEGGRKAEFNKDEPLPESIQDYAQDSPRKIVKAEEAKPKDPNGWSGVWVVIEYNHGEIAPVSWELMGEGRKLADELGCELASVVCGNHVDHVITDAFAYGAEKIYVIDDPVLEYYRSEPYAEGITKLVRKYRPEIMLMGATAMGRDVFPAVATKMQTGLTADCTVLGIDPDTKLLLQTRPAFGGNIMATILCKKHRPQMATVRPRVMKMPERIEGRQGQVIREELGIKEEDVLTKVVEFIKADAKSVFLDKAEIIVAVGLGIGSKRNMAIAEELAETMGATIAGTRGAVESGWLSHDHQVGQTGTTVRPKLYIAIGISGAIQHLVGMERSDYIIAINNDPEASIFRVSNYGIVGDLNEVVPAMTAEMKKRLQYGVAN
ncbi:MAG: electron transfer flavoprotein subunit alpha [Gracilibacter sp. BRH_c7a]|nr:MAG: electron transfer flavoprotein subunit alpha [Gracilibacter sp. BRH_c7a]